MELEAAGFTLRRVFDSWTGRVEEHARRVAQKIDWGDWRAGRPTILCLERALFAKDIAELKKRTGLNLPCVGVVAVKRPQERWVHPKWRRQAHLWHDLNTHLPRTRAILQRFGVAFLRAAASTHPIDAVCAANTDYWQDEALRMGCRELGIPFMALSRESYGIGRGREFVANNYKSGNFYFNGAACAVASETCRQFMLGQGAMRDAMVCATGWPRYDAWRDYAIPPLPQRKLITLMAYGDPSQVQYAAANFRDVLKVFARAAESQLAKPAEARLRFVIKMKKRNEDAYIREIEPDLERLGVEIVADTPLPDLVTRSRMIIGFNTLAVLEGLLASCAIVVPVWSDSERPASACLLHPDNADDAEVCYFPRSAVEFEALLEQGQAGTLPPRSTLEKRLARFSRHSMVTEAMTASARFEAFARDVIARQKGRGA